MTPTHEIASVLYYDADKQSQRVDIIYKLKL